MACCHDRGDDALEKNQTWELVLHPLRMWVYTVKVELDDIVDHLKAQLVAKRFTQLYDENYLETFSPITKITSIWIMFSLTVDFSVFISVWYKECFSS